MGQPTVRVYTKAFGAESIVINEIDFDPEIHRKEADGPWPVDPPKGKGR